MAGGLRVVLMGAAVVVYLSGVVSSLTFFFGRGGGIGVRCVCAFVVILGRALVGGIGGGHDG